MIQIALKVTDSDTGSVTQEIIVCQAHNMSMAETIMRCVSESNCDPNRDFVILDQNVECFHCEKPILGRYVSTPRVCCSGCLRKELEIVESHLAELRLFSDGTIHSLGYRHMEDKVRRMRGTLKNQRRSNAKDRMSANSDKPYIRTPDELKAGLSAVSMSNIGRALVRERIRLGQKVRHADLYDGNEVMIVVGIRFCCVGISQEARTSWNRKTGFR